jgi:hypothetical protein
MSYLNYHRKLNRAIPDMYCNYKLTLTIYKTHNDCLPESDWIELYLSKFLMSRQNYFHINKPNYNLVELNSLSIRVYDLNH